MVSIKRKALETQLQRRVRARRHPSEELSDISSDNDSTTLPHEQASYRKEGRAEDLNEGSEVDLSVSLFTHHTYLRLIPPAGW
jgi:hypothetical protein